MKHGYRRSLASAFVSVIETRRRRVCSGENRYVKPAFTDARLVRLPIGARIYRFIFPPIGPADLETGHSCITFAFRRVVAFRYGTSNIAGVRLYETAGGPSGTVRFLYDGDELVAEYDGSGNMLRRYVHGSGSDDPMAWFEGASVDAGVAKLIKTDHQGSVIALTDWNGNRHCRRR